MLLLGWLFGTPSRLHADDTAGAPAVRFSDDVPDEPASKARAQRVNKKHAKKKRRKRARSHDGWRVDTTLSTHGGGLHGLRERPVNAAAVGLEAQLRPRWSAGDFELALPLGAGHRETSGAKLRETHAEGKLKLRQRVARSLRVRGALAARAVVRPDWPDLYQPSGGGYLGTDRYSYWTRSAELGLSVHPARRNWLQAAYAYDLSDYAADPTFDAVARPDHLTPFDQQQHSVEVGHRFARGRLQIRTTLAGSIRRYFFVFSRDAHTGSTHAGPNGPPPNPLLELHGFNPALQIELPLTRRATLEVRYEHEFQDDVFQGYLSLAGPHPSIELHWSPMRSLALRAGAEMWWRRYGEGSYRAGPGHPALDSGDRRHDHRLQTAAGAKLTLSGGFTLELDGRYLLRDANFPDYRPGVFPQTQRYAIDWDYTNLLVTLGLGWRAVWI